MSNLTNNTQNLQRVLESLQGKAAGGGGGGGGIIEVLQLPTENIDNRYLYRVTVAALYLNNVKQGTTHVVAELPEVGEPLTMDGASVLNTYYNDTDNTLYGYLPAMIGAALGVPEGWYPATMLIPAFGLEYGGVITNLGEAIENNTFYLLLTNPLYSYEDGNWYEVATTGATLTLKTRVFSNWDEAIRFRLTHDVYRIQVNGLTAFYSDGFQRELRVTNYVTSFDNDIYMEFAQWGLPIEKTYVFITGTMSDLDPIGYSGYMSSIGEVTSQQLVCKALERIDSSNVEKVIIYYFE